MPFVPVSFTPPAGLDHPAFRLRSSWVRAADADLDPVLYHVVAWWLKDAWPFERVEYAVRPRSD